MKSEGDWFGQSNALRIAFISPFASQWGGSEELWSQTAARLSADQGEITICVKHWSTEADQVRKLRAKGCRIIKHSAPRSFPRRLLDKVIPAPSVVEREATWLDDFHPDLVVISESMLGEGADWAEACSRRGLPFAIIVHVAAELMWPNDADALRLRALFRSARCVYFVSEATRILTTTQLAADLPDSKVIRNPFNVPYGSPIPWPIGNPFRLACVGRLQPGCKGQDLLFNVLRQDKWRSRPAEVTLYGQGVNQRNVEDLRELWQLDHVKCRGFLEPRTIWEREQVLVLPSRVEGLPIVIVEAMMCGRPCIVTDVAGNAELIEDGVTGFVAAAPAFKLLDEAMERAWERRDQWETMGRLAAERIRKHIPEDPVGVFVQELKQLVSSIGSSGRR